MPTSASEAFGRLLVERVRDAAILEWDSALDGRMIDPGSVRIREQLSNLTEAERQHLHWLIPQIVDTTLHHLLWTLEQVEWVDVAVRTESQAIASLREVSDGLAGDLYGWIPEYTRQRYEEP